MFALSDEALGRADQKVPPDYTAQKESKEEIDLDMAAEHVDATQDLSQFIFSAFSVFRIQHHEPEVTGDAEQAGKS